MIHAAFSELVAQGNTAQYHAARALDTVAHFSQFSESLIGKARPETELRAALDAVAAGNLDGIETCVLGLRAIAAKCSAIAAVMGDRDKTLAAEAAALSRAANHAAGSLAGYYCPKTQERPRTVCHTERGR